MPPQLPTLTPSQRQKRIARLIRNIMFANLAVAAAKGAYGYAVGSLAISSDALHSTLDGLMNVVGLVMMKLAFAPPDQKHPYGHAKIEVLASAVVGVAVGVAGIRFGWGAVLALLHESPAPTPGLAGFVLILGTWFVNMAVAAYEARQAKILNSPFLAADAAHTASDVFATAAVLVSMLGSALGWRWADPIGALAIFFVISRIAWVITTQNLGVLLDGAVLDAEEVSKLALAHPDVLRCHKVRSRGLATAAAVDLHIHLDPQMSLSRAHEVAHEVEAQLKAALPQVTDVVIHTEPGKPA